LYTINYKIIFLNKLQREIKQDARIAA
jgi:hypothetical protein